MSEQKHISKPEEVKKTNSGNALKEVSTSSQEATYGVAPGEMAFSSLQSTADRSSRSNGITQLQEKANQSKGIFQLQAKADSRSTRVTEPIQTKASDTATTQLKGERTIQEDQGLEQEGSVMGTKTVQLAKVESPPVVPNKPSGSADVAQLEKDKESSSKGGGVDKKENGTSLSANTTISTNAETIKEKPNLSIIQSETEDIKKEILSFKPLIPGYDSRIDQFNSIKMNIPTWESLVKKKDKIIELQKKFGVEQEKLPPGRKSLLLKSGKGEFAKLLGKDFSTLWEKEYQGIVDIINATNEIKNDRHWHNLLNFKSKMSLFEKNAKDKQNVIGDGKKITENAILNKAQDSKNKFTNALVEIKKIIVEIQKFESSIEATLKELGKKSDDIKQAPPLSVEFLQRDFEKLQTFVDDDFETWKKEKEEFKMLEEKSKALFSFGLTKEEKAKLESYKRDVFLNVSSDDISEGDIKTSLGNMSSFSSKSKEKETSTNLKNEDPSQLENLEEQIKLKEKEVKEKSSGIFGRGAANQKLELAELKARLKEFNEKERFKNLSPEEQEIELKQKEVNEKSSWIPGRGADKQRLELADLKTKLNEKKEKERFEKLSPSKQAIELKQRDIKNKSSRFFGLGADKEKAQLAKLLAKEKDEEERVQYKNLKEVVYSPEENEAKEFIKKSEGILSDLDWKSLEDKEKYYKLIKSTKLDKVTPTDPSLAGASSVAQLNASKANLDAGKGLIEGKDESKATDSDSNDISLDGKVVDEKQVKELVKVESEFYTPIVMELFSTILIIDDLKKIKDGKLELDAKEKAILTKKFATAAMYGMKISDNLLNHTAVSFTQIVPGLGLLIHMATAAATFFTKLLAITSKDTMNEFSKDFDDLDLKNDLVFWDDKRGALSVKEIFRKVKPTFLEEADTYLEENTEKIGDFNKKYGLNFKNDEELKKYVGEVQTRELIVKLHEINLKREVHANWNMASELAVVSGDISNMIAGGQLVAGIFYGAGGMIKLGKKAAVAVNRASNGEENAFNPFGEDGMKHKEYVVHSKQIISMYTKNIPLLSPKNEEDKKKLSVNVNVAEKVVVAAGAHPAEVYKEAGKDKKGYKAVNKLVSAMKKGRS